jgi:hypothetical protein
MEDERGADVAGMNSWTAEWSVKWDGVGKVAAVVGEKARGEGRIVSHWSRQEPLRGKV